MRILFVSQEMPPDTGWGGIGTYVDVMSEALARNGHDVHVLSAVHGQLASRVQRRGLTIHRYNVPRIPDPTARLPESWRRVLLGLSVATLLRRLDIAPDVIECPEWMAEGLVLGFSESVPLVVRLHSSARQIFPFGGQGTGCRGLDGRLAMWLEDLAVRRGHVVTSTGPNFEEVAERLRLDDQAMRVVPVPVHLPQAWPLDVDAPPRVTFVGRLEPRKAPEVLLRAVPKVLDAVPETEFVFVGRDVMPPGTVSSADWIRSQAARLGVTEAVTLTGELDRAGVEAQLRRATVCAFPSRWESFGIAVAEASAVGRPVVTTRIPAFRDLVVDGRTGRLVEGEDVDGWAATLIELLRDPALAQRMGQAGAAHVSVLCDPGRAAELALAAYEEARRRWLRRRRAGARRAEPTMPVSEGTIDSSSTVARDSEAPGLGAGARDGSSPVMASVIMCVHNGEATMADQLEALAGQDYDGPWELLVVDNASSDGTGAIARAWSDRLPMLRVVEANDRLGLAHARNVGAAAARGQILAFCDADDVADPGWLSGLTQALEGADLAGGALELELLNSGLAQYWRGMFKERLDWPYLDYLPYVVGANFAIRRQAYEAVGGCDERFLTCGDDVDLSWRVQRAGGRLVFTPAPVMHYRLREDLRGVMTQRYRYGMVEALLRRKFSDSVRPMDWRARRQSVLRHMYRSWHLLAGRFRRGAWLAHAANLAGQLRGSLRYRVWA
jgi:glycosyltransferase involved in cell wall biosynthesis